MPFLAVITLIYREVECAVFKVFEFCGPLSFESVRKTTFRMTHSNAAGDVQRRQVERVDLFDAAWHLCLYETILFKSSL